MRKKRNKPKLLYFITEDWYFCSHRLPHAIVANKAGFDVVVICNIAKHLNKIKKHGLRVIPIQLTRRSINPIRELFLLLKLTSIYRKEKPDIVQHVAIKPIIYGTIAAKLSGITAIFNSIVGLGYIFISKNILANILKPIIKLALKWSLNQKNSFTILQNEDDKKFLRKKKIIGLKRLQIIPGSGVNTKQFSYSPEPKTTHKAPLIVCVSRMLWDKGINELVKATKKLKERNINFKMALIGKPDPENPASIPLSQIQKWEKMKLIEYWGYVENIEQVYRKCHIVILPSYREGMPKSLLEAASASRPIITTNVPGCREVVKNQINGILVKVKTVNPLATSMKKLIKNKSIREKMGKEGRKIIKAKFSEEIITKQTIFLYKKFYQEMTTLLK